MVSPFLAQIVLAQITVPPFVQQLPPSAQQLIKSAVWSWNHHDTLHYLAIGLGLLIVAWISVTREWNAIFTGLTAVGGFGCLAASAAIFLLGDTARDTDQAAFDREISMELRASHGKSAGYAQLGEPCKTTYDCAPGILCVDLDGAAPRCYARCPTDGTACKDGLDCQTTHGTHICAPRR